ncbi:MAG TPA: CobD/CbiB family protein [Rhodocyclaceae bacterium]|jgi:adenosylcobinamide-phosphate synthase|nr:CobD/CbiB family protein [Rhodocyclaceae bacterium]
MSLFAIIITLLIEQVKPLDERRYVLSPLARYGQVFEHQFNDGQQRHGMIAWLIAVLLPVVLLLILQGLLWYFQPLLALVCSIGVLYLTLGFRHSSHFFTDIHKALRDSDIALARQLLAEWRHRSGDRLTSNEVARLAIEEALIASHRHVFAPIFWFAIFGPAGAVLYRLALFFNLQWGGRGLVEHDAEFGEFGRFARKAYAVIDWAPVRCSAAAFAIVGDFEDAIYCWRSQAQTWVADAYGILLASGAGALGVRLGLPLHDDAGDLGDRPELGLGDDADVDFLQSTIGLVWRTLLLFMFVLTLFWLGSLVGG